MTPVDDGHCFACGPHNEQGLHLRFAVLGEGRVEARIALPEHLQGWRGIAHGGVVMMLLDEAMAHAAGAVGQRGLTAQMSMRFRKPVPLGHELIVSGEVAWRRRKVIGLSATVAAVDGSVLATGTGSFVSGGTIESGALGAADVVTGEV